MCRPVLILVCCFLNVLLAQGPKLERAWKLAANGDRQGAEAVLHRLLKTEPGNADAHLLLGSLLTEDGNREAGIAELQAAVDLRPDSAEAWNALGETYNRFDDRPRARAAFARAVALNPRFGIAQSNLGAALLDSGDKSAAAEHLDRAIPLLGHSADAADALYFRAKIDLDTGNSAAAVSHLDKAVALRPDFAEAWSDLGQAKKLLLDEPGALAAFQRAVALKPSDAVAQYRLGAEYLRQEKVAQAIDPLEAAARLNGGDQSTLNALAAALRRVGRKEEAAAVKQKLAQLLHDRDIASQNALTALRLNNEGTELEKSGNLPEAVNRYEHALELNPDHNGIRVNYAVALLRSGRWREGLEQMHLAGRRDPNNEKIQTALKDALAQAPPDTLPGWAKDLLHNRNSLRQ